MKLLEDLRSPFIVNFVGAVVFPGRMCIVTEFIPHGSLGSLLRKEELSYLLKVRMCFDCAKGMMYLHSFKMMHRDFKPENLIVLSLNELDPVTCKLTDFGSTREVGEEISKNYTKGIGTPRYMAPEVLQDQGYTVSADVYSFGISLCEVYTNKEPFDSFDSHKSW
jgi:serine/threonine protein kinase